MALIKKEELGMERASLFCLLQNVTSLRAQDKSSRNTCNMVTGESRLSTCCKLCVCFQ